MSETRAIRFRVIAHASPRWRGAANAADADKRNQALAQQRETSVSLAVVRLLRETLGWPVEISSAVSHAENVPPVGISVGGHSVGSRESLQATKGNRENNDQQYRKVEVIFEKFSTSTAFGEVSTGQVSTKTAKWWTLHIVRLSVDYRVSGTGEVDLVLTNDMSKKSVTAKALLNGSGFYVGFTPSRNIAKMIFSVFTSSLTVTTDVFKEKKGIEHAFACDRPMGFGDFVGQTITFEKKTYSVGLKGHTMSVSFPFLGPEAWMMLSPMGGLGGIGEGHYQVSGPLRLTSPNPGDFMEADPDMVSNNVTGSKQFRLTLTFPTEKGNYGDIPFLERMRFESLVEGFAKYYQEAP